MKCYYPTDKSGNRIGFKTPEACIFDTSGTNLTKKLNQLRSDVNGKAAASHGHHVPTPQSANNKVYLRNDNTWHTLTPADIGAAASSHSHSWDSITGKPSLYTTSQIDSKISAINSNINGRTEGTIWIGDRMHIDERKYAYGYTNDGGANRVMKSKYDIYLYGIQHVNVANGSAKSDWTFTYCGDHSYVGNGTMGFNIPYKYLTPGSILSITGFVVAESPNNTVDIGYYPLPYFEPEDNPGSGIDIHSVVVHTNSSKTGSAITITVNKHTRCGTWNSTNDRYYYFYFKVESSGNQSV